MLEILGNYTGPLVINGKNFKNKRDAEEFLNNYKGGVTITLGGEPSLFNSNTAFEKPVVESNRNKNNEVWYELEVKRYMTNYNSSFFLNSLNEQGPMPFIIMIGKKLEESQKMVKMECYPEIRNTRQTRCIKCGRTLFDEVSQYMGIGLECGFEKYRKQIQSGEEPEIVQISINQELKKFKWVGWIIKDAIMKLNIIEDYQI